MPRSSEMGAMGSPIFEPCSSTGKSLYDELMDVLFDASDRWRMQQCVNEACGMLWLDPMPKAENRHMVRSYSTLQEIAAPAGLLARLFRAAADGYRALRFGFKVSDTTAIDVFIGLLVGLLPPKRKSLAFPLANFDGVAKGKMLEIGCGGGDALKMFADKGWMTEGVNFDQAAVANARAKELTVHQGDLVSCGYASASFDAIYSRHVIEHVSQPRELLVECYRLLKPGGRCVILTPNAGSVGHQRSKMAWRGLEPPRHPHIFKQGALANLAQAAGFANFRITTSSRLAEAMYIQSELTRRDGRPGMRAPFNVKVAAALARFTVSAFQLIRPDSGEELVFAGYKRYEE